KWSARSTHGRSKTSLHCAAATVRSGRSGTLQHRCCFWCERLRRISLQTPALAVCAASVRKGRCPAERQMKYAHSSIRGKTHERETDYPGRAGWKRESDADGAPV